MSTQLNAPDQRPQALEIASLRAAYLVLSFGILLVVAYRSFILGENTWDLLTLVILGGIVAAGYQRRPGVPAGRWVILSLIATATALIAAFLLAVRNL